MTSPHLRPFGPFMVAGSVGQSGTRRYGFGSVDGLGTVASLPPWARAATARAAATTTALTATVGPTRPPVGILELLQLISPMFGRLDDAVAYRETPRHSQRGRHFEGPSYSLHLGVRAK